MEAAADAKMEYEQEPPAAQYAQCRRLFLRPAGKRHGLRCHIFNSLRVW